VALFLNREVQLYPALLDDCMRAAGLPAFGYLPSGKTKLNPTPGVAVEYLKHNGFTGIILVHTSVEYSIFVPLSGGHRRPVRKIFAFGFNQGFLFFPLL